MMIMQNACATLDQDQLGDEALSYPVENEYENVETLHLGRQCFFPVRSPYVNIDHPYPTPPNPTPSSRPTSSSACFYMPGNNVCKHYGNKFDPSQNVNHQCYSHSEYIRDVQQLQRPVFFSPQPQKPDMPPPILKCSDNRKLRQSVKRAVSDGQAKKVTKNKNRKLLMDRNKYIHEVASDGNSCRG